MRLRETDETAGHTLFAVYREIILQICTDYSGLPDVRTMPMRELRFFYDGVRPALLASTKPKG